MQLKSGSGERCSIVPGQVKGTLQSLLLGDKGDFVYLFLISSFKAAFLFFGDSCLGACSLDQVDLIRVCLRCLKEIGYKDILCLDGQD